MLQPLRFFWLHSPALTSQMLPASSEVPEFSLQRRKSLNASELQLQPSGFADAVKKLGEPTIIKHTQVESSQKVISVLFLLRFF
jgi:hypothetical protein